MRPAARRPSARRASAPLSLTRPRLLAAPSRRAVPAPPARHGCAPLRPAVGAISWFDPTNPVVPMSGGLRQDGCERLHELCERCDLVIAFGTSLSGLSADRVVSAVGGRALDEGFRPEPLGAVIVSLQQTRLDGVAALRLFATCDEVCARLAAELGVTPAPVRPPLAHDDGACAWELPIDAANGDARAGARTTVRLHTGARVKLTMGNAPLAREGDEGTVVGRTAQGHFRLLMDAPPAAEVLASIAAAAAACTGAGAGAGAGGGAGGSALGSLIPAATAQAADDPAHSEAHAGRLTFLGSWWLDEALNGTLEADGRRFPLLNV